MKNVLLILEDEEYEELEKKKKKTSLTWTGYVLMKCGVDEK